MRLNNNAEAIQQEFGFDPQERLLFANIRRDAVKIVRPIIAERDDEKLLLVRQQETASVLFAGVPQERVRFHSEWIAFDRRIVAGYEVAEDLSSLIWDLAGDEQVSLAPGICYAHLQEIERRATDRARVEVEADPCDTAPVSVYELTEQEVEARFRAWREQGVAFGRDFAGRFPGLEGIEEYFDAQTDTRFSALGELAQDQGVDGVYLAAPPNFSEVTGRRDAEGLGALWVPATGKVLVLAEDAAPGFAGTPVARFASRAEALRELLPGTALGVEEEHITASFARSLEAAGLGLTNVSVPLGSWRDLRDVEDLPFVLIACRASTHAMEGALQKLSDRLEAGQDSSEDVLYADYLAGIQEFRVEQGVPFAIEPYFVNQHASDRTLFPTTPTDAPITKDSVCVELDTGVKVTIDGVVLATSDMGRSLPLTPGAAQAYDTLTRVIREHIIPSIRPGVAMSQVHADAVDTLTAVRGELEEAGLLAADTDFVSWYNKRNVGHLMGKQESFANELRPGYTHVLRVGDYGAAETPWRFGETGISTEDLWFIGRDRTFTLTLSE
ncbi:M24 family metallopeptidase [Leucobacter sp. GX24907]